MDAVIVAIVSYLIGSIPFAVIISYIFKLGDIRKFGSGNPGATNMLRFGGKKPAAATLLLDAGKGALAVWLAVKFDAGNIGFLAVIIGHCFSLFLRFKGGKGVATTLGGLLMLNTVAGVVCVGLWIAVYLLSRISSAAALVSINLTALASLFFWPWISYVMLPVAGLITFRHKSNIRKLLEGTEK